MAELCARPFKALKKYDGDILATPGQGEIHKTADLLKGKVGATRVHMLYGQLPQNKQRAAIFQIEMGIGK